MSALQLAGYASILFFVIVVAAKMIKIARMPIHIRWDLYPIPHEKGKGSYGGSYFEELDWWTKPSNFSLSSEIGEMLKEILLIQSVFHHNRPLWYFSFPFHAGLYCLCGFTGLLVIGAVMNIAGLEVSGTASGFGALVHQLTAVVGTIGWFATAIGSVGLLFSRMFRNELQKSSVLSDYFNLLFLLAVTVVGIIAWLTVDPSYALLRTFIQSLISLQPAAAVPTAVAVQIWLVVALLFYFPFTHMTHMFGKYFTYHKIRWEDEPNIRGSKIEAEVNEALGRSISWAAPHIKAGGSWADAATAPEEDGKK